MKRKSSSKMAAVLMVVSVLSGCTTMTVTPQMRSALNGISSETRPTCEGAACTDLWARAQIWVSNHATMKIQVATDTILETYNPMLSCPGIFAATWQPEFGFKAVKEPQGNGIYRISMTDVRSCGWGNIGVTKEDLERAFYHYIKTSEDILAMKAEPANKQAGRP